MQSLLLGLLVLGAGYLLLKWWVRANARALSHLLPTLVAGAALFGALVYVLRGSYGMALLLSILGVGFFAAHRSRIGQGGPGSAGPMAGQTSRIRTEHLELELDHDSGALSGQILKGYFAGRTVQSLRPVELAHLWQDCRLADPQSAQLIEAYLDRVHPSWRDDIARAEAETPKGADGRMTRAEALEILGLDAAADATSIRRAHRELMLKLHPDRGGSTYLAAKINEAKSVLLGADGGLGQD